MLVKLACLLAIAFSQQVIPFPQTPEVYTIGAAESSTVIEVYLDLLCPHTKAAYAGFKAFFEKYQDKVQVKLHLYPATVHTYGFVVTQLGHWIQHNKPDVFLAYINYMMENQAAYNEPDNLSYDIVGQMLQDNIPGALGNALTAAQVATAIQGHTEWDYVTRIAWKQACGRSVYNTPTFMLNGVRLMEAPGYTTLADWDTFFTGFWNGNYSATYN